MGTAELDHEIDSALARDITDGVVVDSSWEQEHMLSMEGLTTSQEARRWLLFRCHGPLVPSAVSNALDFLMRRHEALRMVFPIELRPARALLLPPGSWPLITICPTSSEASDASATAAAAVRQLCDRLDPERGPLVAAALIEGGPDQWYLAITMHMLAWDGFSSDLFRREFSHAYNAFHAGQEPQLRDIRRPYTAIARAQRDGLSGADGHRRLDYWFRQFDQFGPAPVFHLVDEEPDAATVRQATGHADFDISTEAAQRLIHGWRKRGTTSFVGISAAILMAVARRKAFDGPVGAKVSETGRYTADTLQALGPLGSGLPVWVDIEGCDDYDRVVTKVHSALFEMLEHTLPLRPMLTGYVAAREGASGFSLDEFKRIRAEPSLRLAAVPYVTTSPDLEEVTVTDVSTIVPLAYRSSAGMLINVYEIGSSWRIRAEFPLDSYAPAVIEGLVRDAGEILERWDLS
ncbi:condensation domain-containing protein [Streptomyces sp. NPDC015350]|uniref:condensation domain-containing protein n=1 Tax=Streptomyces sp. NPDC015350 TaxID=3364955 RepID=UPI0036FE4102